MTWVEAPWMGCQSSDVGLRFFQSMPELGAEQFTQDTKEAPINLPQPHDKLNIPCRSALFITKRHVRTALSGFSTHFAVLYA